METNKKRLFFALEIAAPWPHENPTGRIIDENHRHITLAFLGNVIYEKVKELLPIIPVFSTPVSPVGICDECLFLPKRFPHVVACHVNWLSYKDELTQFQKQLIALLKQANFQMDDRDFLPHVTICRSPFNAKEWKRAFVPLPCMARAFHLYESKGNLRYEPIWSHPLKPAFEEIEHTADIAYQIQAENVQQLYVNALTALAFRAPGIISYYPSFAERLPSNLEEVIMMLNTVVAKADAEIGCPFKAVSFHGDLIQQDDATIQWEMIVDV